MYDTQKSKAARDAAIQAVMDPNVAWKERVRARVELLPVGWQGIGEDIRRLMNGDEPHHHNAWGGVIRGLVTAGVLVDTGASRNMALVDSHARRSPLYYRRLKGD